MCPTDCPCACGDFVCGRNEVHSCPSDCCGDGVCDAGEVCPIDCCGPMAASCSFEDPDSWMIGNVSQPLVYDPITCDALLSVSGRCALLMQEAPARVATSFVLPQASAPHHEIDVSGHVLSLTFSYMLFCSQAAAAALGITPSHDLRIAINGQTVWRPSPTECQQVRGEAPWRRVVGVLFRERTFPVPSPLLCVLRVPVPTTFPRAAQFVVVVSFPCLSNENAHPIIYECMQGWEWTTKCIDVGGIANWTAGARNVLEVAGDPGLAAQFLMDHFVMEYATCDGVDDLGGAGEDERGSYQYIAIVGLVCVIGLTCLMVCIVYCFQKRSKKNGSGFARLREDSAGGLGGGRGGNARGAGAMALPEWEPSSSDSAERARGAGGGMVGADAFALSDSDDDAATRARVGAVGTVGAVPTL